jgi:hypothetical protein
MAVVADANDRTKMRDKTLAAIGSLEPLGLPAAATAARPLPASRASPLKLPLHKIHCRWTV